MNPAIVAILSEQKGRRSADKITAVSTPPSTAPSLANSLAGDRLTANRRDVGKGSKDLSPHGLKRGLVLAAPERYECPECGNTELTDIDGRRFCECCGRYI
jgi:hypothetical protein